MSTLVAIHQPNFLPWLGWFDKLARADVLVLLDDAQFPKKGGTWTNRVRLLVSSRPAWVTVPVDRSYHGTRQIREMRIDDSRPWRDKLSRTIEQSYARAPCFGETMPLVHAALGLEGDLATFNEHGLRAVASHLGLDGAKLVRSSELEVGSTATDRLIDLTIAVGGDSYLAGGGAEAYQEDEKFAQANIQLVRQAFNPPSYEQLADAHVPRLSIVDALMSCGAAATRGFFETR